MASKKLQNFENVHVVSRPLDHGHGRPYSWGSLYKHVSHKYGERSSENLTLFMGNFMGVPVRQMHGSDRLRLMQNFFKFSILF